MNRPAESDGRCFTCRTSSCPLAQVPLLRQRKRFGNPRLVGISGWDATGGILTHFGLEDEAFRYFPGWTLGPQGAKNSTCGLQYEALERVNTWRRSSGLQPREVKRQHMYLHMSRHPRGPEELILTPPLPPRCRLAAPASLPVVSVQNLKKEKKIIAVPETIRVNYSLQMPAGQWERCFVL